MLKISALPLRPLFYNQCKTKQLANSEKEINWLSGHNMPTTRTKEPTDYSKRNQQAIRVNGTNWPSG